MLPWCFCYPLLVFFPHNCFLLLGINVQCSWGFLSGWRCHTNHWRFVWSRSGNVRGEGGERHHSADFLLRGRCHWGETLANPPPPCAYLFKNSLICMQLSYPPLAEGFVQGSAVKLVSMGCSDWLGSAAVRMQVCGGSLCCISLLLIQKPALSSKPYLYAAAAGAAAAIILSLSTWGNSGMNL